MGFSAWPYQYLGPWGFCSATFWGEGPSGAVVLLFKGPEGLRA